MSKLLWIEVVILVALVAAALGHKLGLLPFKPAFALFALALLAALGLPLLGIVLRLLGVIGTGWGALVLCGVVALLPLVVIGTQVGKGVQAPPIHDISTSAGEGVIGFEHAPTLRDQNHNSLGEPSDKTVSLQRKHYPELGPLKLEGSVPDVYRAATEVAESLGWRIRFRNEQAFAFEATDETLLFGFTDDVRVEITRIVGTGEVRVDVRSVSRVGVGDLGANAARIRRFLSRLEAHLTDR